MMTKKENIGTIVIGIVVIVGILAIWTVNWDIKAVDISRAEDCQNDKVLLVFEDNELVARYAEVCSVRSGVWVGHDGKHCVEMYACGIGRTGFFYLESNQAYQLVDE
jgi:hypothetical protein